HPAGDARRSRDSRQLQRQRIHRQRQQLVGGPVSELDQLLESYLDLARHLDPLRHPHEAPAEVQARLGRFDRPWLSGQVSALRSIGNAIEDIEGVDSLADEVDRTMLLDTVRADIRRLSERINGPTSDP